MDGLLWFATKAVIFTGLGVGFIALAITDPRWLLALIPVAIFGAAGSGESATDPPNGDG